MSSIQYLRLSDEQRAELAKARAAVSEAASACQTIADDTWHMLDEMPADTRDLDIMRDEASTIADVYEALESQWGALEQIVPMEDADGFPKGALPPPYRAPEYRG